jgi:tetratricopeptide (TPR) repeat protein
VFGVIESGESLARSAGLVGTLLRGLNNRAIPQSEMDPTATLAAVEEALALARRMGLRQWIFSFSASVGMGNVRFGDWDRATTVLGAALAEDPADEDRIALLFAGMLGAALRGEEIAGEVAEIEHLIGSSTDVGRNGTIHNARAAAAFSEGDLADAQAEFHLAAEVDPSDTDANMDAAHLAFWRGDLPGAAAELAAIDSTGFRTPAVEARRVMIRAGLAAGEGRVSEALGLYRDALRRWRDLRLVIDEVKGVVDMATLLDPAEPEVRAAAEAARETLVRIKAKPLLDRLDAAMARRPSAPKAKAAIPVA